MEDIIHKTARIDLADLSLETTEETAEPVEIVRELAEGIPGVAELVQEEDRRLLKLLCTTQLTWW